MKGITNLDLKNILESITDPIEVDCKGSSVHRHEIEIQISTDIILYTEIVVVTNCIPSNPSIDEGYLRYDPPEINHRIKGFDFTDICIDGEGILTDDQKDIVESHILDLIEFS